MGQQAAAHTTTQAERSEGHGGARQGREKRGEEDRAGVVWCGEAPGVPRRHVPGAAQDVSITQTEHKHSSLLPNSHHPPIITTNTLTHSSPHHHPSSSPSSCVSVLSVTYLNILYSSSHCVSSLHLHSLTLPLTSSLLSLTNILKLQNSNL